MATAPYRHVGAEVSPATRLASVNYLIDGAGIKNAIIFLGKQRQISGLRAQFGAAWAIPFGIGTVTLRAIVQKIVLACVIVLR